MESKRKSIKSAVNIPKCCTLEKKDKKINK